MKQMSEHKLVGEETVLPPLVCREVLGSGNVRRAGVCIFHMANLCRSPSGSLEERMHSEPLQLELHFELQV